MAFSSGRFLFDGGNKFAVHLRQYATVAVGGEFFTRVDARLHTGFDGFAAGAMDAQGEFRMRRKLRNADYVEGFRRIFPALAEKNSAPLVPFLLEGVAAQPDLNQADGIHPNSAGHARMAETVWLVLSPLLKSRP